MSLTEAEKAKLVNEKANAKVRTREIWVTVCALKKMLKTYQKDYQRWSDRFQSADRKLAEEEKLVKYSVGGKPADLNSSDGLHLLVKMDKSQIRRIAEELGIRVSEEEDIEDN